MFCKYCGKEIADSAKFCAGCGRAQVISQPVQVDTAPKKSNGVLIAMVVVLSVALVLVLGFFLFPRFISQSGDNKKPNSGPQEWENSTGGNGVADNRVLSEGNPYENCILAYADYVLPGSDSSYKCYEDIARLTPEERYIAVQEIYARQGVTFTDANLREYFENRTWYTPGGSFRANSYEQANLDLLEVFEAVENGSWAYSGNPYVRAFSTDRDYANAFSNTRYLTANELMDLSAVQLEVMRNEIFARQGVLFNDEDLRMYFYSKPWYRPTVPSDDFDGSVFNEFESSNVKLIQVYEKRALGVTFSHDNPYRQYYDPRHSYVFSYSDSLYLKGYDVESMTLDQLCIARNEILARHGYTFKDQHLLEYFLQFDWYLPSTPEGDGSQIQYTEVELANVHFLKEMEKAILSVADLSRLDTGLTYKVTADQFSVKLPAYFKTYAKVENKGNAIKCSENLSPIMYEFNDGFMYSFCVSKDEYFTELPSYDYLGILKNDEGDQYYLYAWFATDVRFSEPFKELYRKMDNEYSRIAATVEGAGGYTFYPA